MKDTGATRFAPSDMDPAGKRILVVGLGVTGIAVARFLKNRGARVTVTDISSQETLGGYAREARELGLETRLGGHKTDLFQNADLIVISPGVPHTIEPVLRAKKSGISVWGEIELAFRFIREPVVAVTGTNGKTTTTALLGEMLTGSGFEVFVGGNIGNPLIGFVDSGKRADFLVVEMSSFQLDTIESFRPKIGMVLNIGKDHMDRYSNMETYAGSKGRLFENQGPADIAILNGADPRLRMLGKTIRGRKLFFNASWDDEEGAMLNGSRVLIQLTQNQNRRRAPGFGGRATFSFDLSNMKLIGPHNRENASAACLAACAAGGTREAIQHALNTFRALRHRLEWVATIDHVSYINDSKATNVDAAASALKTFDRPVILILGGRDKGLDFSALKGRVRRQVKKIIAIGEASDRLMSVFGNITPTVKVSGMPEAVRLAKRAAKPEDIVLLSPACSSFDMFMNYEQRGDAFCHAVRQLI